MTPHDLSGHFLTWQCRIRQIAMREHGGRPSPGMCPKVLDGEGQEISPGIIVLLIRLNPYESTEFLKFQVQKNNDPEEVYKKAMTFLQSTHYHGALEFSDEMSALFGPQSQIADRLLTEGKCALHFSEFNQNYVLPCRVRQLDIKDPAFEATYWHNRIFNPTLGTDVQVLGFQPDWDEAVTLMKNYRGAV